MNILPFKINSFRAAIPASFIALAALAVACEDETSKIGSSLTEGKISISIDTIEYDLNATAVPYENYDARTGNLLLGNIVVPEYGKLNCSFVSRLMCATKLEVPDSLFNSERVDSCKFRLIMTRGDLTGDSLAPQKVTIYALTKQLPDGITNEFDPTGYYDPSSPLGSTSFTASLAGAVDTTFTGTSTSTIVIDIDLPKQYGVDIFNEYKNNPSLFQWPSTFAQKYPGYYVETSFGKGCVSNIDDFGIMVYYWYSTESTSTVDGETVTTTNTNASYVIPFLASPEVLSSNNISYVVSDKIERMIADGETVITTPGGYNASFKFPARQLIDHYEKDEHNLSLISELLLSIPAEPIDNGFSIGTAPTLMLIKTSEIHDFFAGNKIPDNVSSFTASYDSTNNRYLFSSMRSYIIDLIKKGTITDEDLEFTIIPVTLTTETSTSSYYSSSTSYVTKCKPYTTKPTMTRLYTDKASVIFTFSSQIIE